MGREAAARALADAGLTAGDITHVLYATCTGDYTTPSASCLLCDKLGIAGRFAVDLNAACSGCLFGLVAARGLIAAEPEAKVLLVAGEALSGRTNWRDRSTCVLFGDGAAALVLGASGKERPLAVMEDIETGADGSLGPLLHFGGPRASGEPYKVGDPVGEEYFISMNGRDVYKHAVRNMAAVSKDVLARNGMTVDSVDLLVPHQANMRIIEAVGARLGIPAEKVYVNLPETGNTSAASIPLALDEARRRGRLKPGMRVLTCTFGGGLTWSAALFRF
jgi:3-oxoacyl-[acyl-carrier-protein] synthase-3